MLEGVKKWWGTPFNPSTKSVRALYWWAHLFQHPCSNLSVFFALVAFTLYQKQSNQLVNQAIFSSQNVTVYAIGLGSAIMAQVVALI